MLLQGITLNHFTLKNFCCYRGYPGARCSTACMLRAWPPEESPQIKETKLYQRLTATNQLSLWHSSCGVDHRVASGGIPPHQKDKAFFFLLYYSRPRVECYKSPRALNTSPPWNRKSIINALPRTSCPCGSPLLFMRCRPPYVPGLQAPRLVQYVCCMLLKPWRCARGLRWSSSMSQ